jgi:hypothetical protein
MPIRPVLLLAALAVAGQCAEPPRLERRQHRVDLMVDGKPWLILGGELRNSSASRLEFLQPIWPHLRALHLNTVFAPVSWKQMEPEEGRYDFTLVDGLLSGARRHNLRLALLWLATWKNGVSGYAPAWVMLHPERFPRMSATALSPLGAATAEADARAFAALLRRLREVDGERQTVLMVQVENEMGVLGASRDRSRAAEAAFAGPVPKELLDSLARDAAALKPHLGELWRANGRRQAGSWREVFGPGPEADEVFMAWHYGRFVERVAAAGKREYPLPMYVNAWQVNGEKPQPGVYPSGGPVDRMLDVWMAAAPSIDIYAVDNYRFFKRQCADFRHRGNPLFMPEACAWWGGDDVHSGPARAFYSLGEHDALAFSPFGVDNEMYRGHMLGLAYRKLSGMLPAIAEHRGAGRMHGFYREGANQEKLAFSGWTAVVTYQAEQKQDVMFDTTSGSDDRYGAFGLIVQTGDDEFLAAGRGYSVAFRSADAARPVAVNLSVEEGEFVAGAWRAARVLNGDEVGGNGSECTLRLPPTGPKVIGEEAIAIQRLRARRVGPIER